MNVYGHVLSLSIFVSLGLSTVSRLHYNTGVAKVRLAGRMRPSNLFLRPLDLLSFEKKSQKIKLILKFSDFSLNKHQK